MTCAFNEKKDQDLSRLQNSSFCALEMRACRGSGGGVWGRDPVPIYFLPLLSLASFLPPPTFFFILNCADLWHDPKDRENKVCWKLLFFDIWCQKAFGKLPNSSMYRKSDQILCEILFPFWSLQKRRLYSFNSFLAEMGCQESHPYVDICIQR